MRPLILLTPLCACGSESTLRSTTDEVAGSLAAGSLVITEIMANPSAVDPPWGWVELQNSSGQSLSLDDATLFVVESTAASGQWTWALDGLALEPDEILVIGGPGVEPRPSYIDQVHDDPDARLDPYAGQVGVRSGDQIVDVVSYLNMLPGVSQGLDGLLEPDALVNDDLDAWCDATTEYADGAQGSPGKANEGCPAAGVTCRGADGQVRAIQAPEIGDLLFSEFMADPAGVSDARGEWIEVAVTRDVDLNGVILGTSEDPSALELDSEDCLVATAGSRLLFARSDVPGENGGLAGVTATFSFSLVNDAPSLRLRHGEDLLDELTWTQDITAGAAWSLDETFLSPDANDEASAWCLASVPYGDLGDLGTPGSANTACAPVVVEGTCLDEGSLRAIKAPESGDVYISEFMVNPTMVEDRAGEWIEIAAVASFDANGLRVGTIDADSGAENASLEIDSDECLPVAAGARLILARTADTEAAGGLPWIDEVFSFNLANTGGELFVAFGDDRLDDVTYQEADVEAGASRALGAGLVGPEAASSAWCSETNTYGAGDQGTPGAENLCG